MLCCEKNIIFILLYYTIIFLKDLYNVNFILFFFDDKVDEVEAFVKSPDESPQNAFKSLPKMSKVLVKFNTGVPASAACERLFSVGKDVFSAKQSRLSDKNFERLLMCQQAILNRHLVLVRLKFLWCWPKMSVLVL